MAKTIYVVGGTNGVGKSTIRKDLLDPSVSAKTLASIEDVRKLYNSQIRKN